jgi:tetratricopeptide (TPR) repeat protein
VLCLAVTLLPCPGIVSLAEKDPRSQSANSAHEPYLGDGIEALRKRNLQEAERIFRSAAEQFPNSPDANYWLGVTCTQARKYAEAERALLKGIALRPDFHQAYNALGVLYDEQQLYSKSGPAFSLALARRQPTLSLTLASVTCDKRGLQRPSLGLTRP